MSARVAAAALFLLSAPARADEPVALGAILRSSSGMASTTVDTVDGRKVRVSIMSVVGQGELEYDTGQRVDLELPITYAPRPGSPLLRYCTVNSCPQWVAIERHNFFVVRSVHPDEEVAPGLMELRRGFTQNELCLRARVVWLGQPARLGRLEGSFDPLTGEGIIWGKPLGRPRHAMMAVGAGLGPWPDEALSVTVKGVRDVRFVGGPIDRHHDGCFEVDLLPAAPLARTPAELTSTLAGSPPHHTIIGSLHEAGRTRTTTITVQDDGQILVDGRRPRVDFDDDTFDLRLETAKYVYDLDGLSPPLPGAGIGAALVVAHRIGREIHGKLYRAADGTHAIGTITVP